MRTIKMLVSLFVVYVFSACIAFSFSRPVERPEPPAEREDRVVLEEGWMPPGLDQEERQGWLRGEPPGWSRGEKTGWRGLGMPPGLARQRRTPVIEDNPPQWETWESDARQQWREALERIRERIRRNTRGSDREEMLYSVEAAARKGVPVSELERLTDLFIENRLSGQEYEKTTRAMSHGVAEDVDFRQLGSFVVSNIQEGIRGDELAIIIYREIAEGLENR